MKLENILNTIGTIAVAGFFVYLGYSIGNALMR